MFFRRCKNCILSDQYTNIGANGLCDECVRFAVATPAAPRQSQVLPYAGRGKAIVLLSGGKDSCYMLNRLLKDYPQLELTCLTIDNTFMSPVAKRNVEVMVRDTGVKHILWREDATSMERMFRHEFVNYRRQIDFADGEHVCARAAEVADGLGYDDIIMGMSPEQLTHILGVDSWRNGKFVYPFYAWHNSEREIIAAIPQLKPRDLSPLRTNHQLIPLFAVLDYAVNGWFLYEPELAEMIRSGRGKRRDWINIFRWIEFVSKTGWGLDTANMRRLSLSKDIFSSAERNPQKKGFDHEPHHPAA
jgi:hypothetical protein